MEEAPLVIVKLGGSVITRKSDEARTRAKVLRRLAEELCGPGAPRLIVLHGAGSFGHPGAVRWHLAEAPPPQGDPHRTRGAAIVSAEVRRLHGEVVKELVDAGGRPVSVPVAGVATNRAGKLGGLDTGPFRRWLSAGFTPVSFGDVVLDDRWGCSILSADTIALELARAFHPERVLFVSDVMGVLGPPIRGKRPVVAELSPEVVNSLSPTVGAPDVTGGIRGKAEAMLAIAGIGTLAGLISGLSDGALSRAIRGEAVYGSWAKAAAR
ncbi:MAG: isopentenyl phosphate kinase family protein [Thermoplasmata archaeon]|nr:isopentenyl phosphate kinase family protein [Thermoplasmata archaeon]